MSESTVRHTAVTMSGRDPHERDRTATPLELLFDLTFVVAFGIAADELAHFLAEDHVSAGIVGFCFAMFAVSWAWINFAWFASAYDTDDWVYRLTTMVQMVGVLVLALGLPRDVRLARARRARRQRRDGARLRHHAGADDRPVVRARPARTRRGARPARPTSSTLTGRAGRLDRAAVRRHRRRRRCSPGRWSSSWSSWSGPFVAETPQAARRGTPHHIAERYGLLVIIALGEGLLGTIGRARRARRPTARAGRRRGRCSASPAWR